MATYTTYDQVGKAEDVSDIITNISPTKTPFVSSIGDDTVHARLFEWEEDSLRAVGANAQIEGATATDATLTAMTSRTNNTQILEKTIKVSMTSDAIQTYGRAKETAYQIAKGMEEVKRDLEYAMIGVTQAAEAGSSGVARKMASASSQIHANTTTAGGTAALTEAKVLANHQAVYTEGGDPSVFMIKPADSLIVAGFTGATGRYRTVDANGTTLNNSVKVYVSPFGELKIVLNRFILSTIALTYDPDMWKKCILQNRDWKRTMLAKTGDNEMHQIVGEFSLKHKNQKASGLINALT